MIRSKTASRINAAVVPGEIAGRLESVTRGEECDMSNQTSGLHVEDAFNFIVRYVREGIKSSYSDYGYEVCLPNVMRFYAQSVLRLQDHDAAGVFSNISPPF